MTYDVGIFEAEDATSSSGRGTWVNVPDPKKSDTAGPRVGFRLKVDGAAKHVCVHGSFTHVFVTKGTEQKVAIRGKLWDALSKLATHKPESPSR